MRRRASWTWWRGGLALIAIALCASTASARVLVTNDRDGYTEYLGATGTRRGRDAPFRILVPDKRNGTLLIYTRGTASGLYLTLDPQGRPVPVLDPSGLPIVGVTPLTNVPGAPLGDNGAAVAFEQGLLDAGYTLAASDYRPDPRFLEFGLLSWVVEDGIIDTLSLSLEARWLLRRTGRSPKRTLLWGRSQGSAVALKMFEWVPWLYDGVVSGCSLGAGAPRTWDVGLGFTLGFDAAFAHLGGWEALGAGSPEGGDIPDGLSFAQTVAPVLAGLVSNPSNFPLFEFVRLVSGLPIEGFYPPPLPLAGTEAFNWLFVDTLFLTEVRGDLEGAAKAGGRVSQNRGHVYQLSEADRGYLSQLGLPNPVIDSLLAAMNARTNIDADPNARRYVERFADFSGRIRGPVLSMHTTIDGLVIPAHESALRDTVEAAGKGDKLAQVFATSVGHCTFTADQWLASVQAMQSWLKTRTPPDVSFFPQSLGFDNGFAPPPWPQP